MERFGPTRRGGPVFRWLGEPLAIDLANTIMVVKETEEIDLLGSDEEFRDWLEHERPRLGECSFALGRLEEIRAMRGAVRELFAAAAHAEALPSAAVDLVNAASAIAPVAPQLDLSSEGGPRLVEMDSMEGISDLVGAVARSAIRLIGDQGEAPINLCGAPSCGMFFVGRRRWCCAACGNRARVARHYRRHAQPASRPR